MNKNFKEHTLKNYKKILDHLQEHIDSGEFDEKDIKQSKMLIKEINKLTGGGLIKENEILKYSNPKQVYKNAVEYLGDNVDIDVSTRKDKKYMIYNPKTNRMVHFGQMGYEDFTKHRNLDRRNNYLLRASRIKGNWKDDKYSPNNLSINILW